MLPPLMAILFSGYVVSYVFAKSDAIKARYRKNAAIAYKDKNFSLVKTYYERIVMEERLTPDELYDWAVILSNTGETDRANKLMEELAPDTEAGVALAHRARALQIVSTLGRSKDPEATLRQLEWHLKNSNDNSAEISHARAVFHVGNKELDEAIRQLESSAEKEPKHYLMIAKIYESQGHAAQRVAVLESAESRFRQRLAKDQLDQNTRITLASILNQLGKVDEAEQNLLTGLSMQPELTLRRAVAEFYVMRCQRAQKLGKGAGDQVSHLLKAIVADGEFGLVYQKLIEIYLESSTSREQLIEIRDSLQELVTRHTANAVTHFFMSNVQWQLGEPDLAAFHLRRAFEMNKQIAKTINNFDWTMAQVENSDLERALMLAEVFCGLPPAATLGHSCRSSRGYNVKANRFVFVRTANQQK